jgi:hypothetical protein
LFVPGVHGSTNGGDKVSEKPDNPQDHKHSDYAFTVMPALFALFFAALAFVSLLFWTPNEQDIDDLNQRIDELECRIADDETACLRDVLEETR